MTVLSGLTTAVPFTALSMVTTIGPTHRPPSFISTSTGGVCAVLRFVRIGVGCPSAPGRETDHVETTGLHTRVPVIIGTVYLKLSSAEAGFPVRDNGPVKTRSHQGLNLGLPYPVHR